MRDATAQLRSEHSTDLYRSLPFRRLLQSFATVCQAVAHAHARGIIHRDIKPANIVIGEHGETVLVDWGLAKRIDEAESYGDSMSDIAVEALGNAESHSLTMEGSAIGTPAFMSPEVAQGSMATTASDIFSLGATLFYLLSGKAPLSADNAEASLQKAREHAIDDANLNDSAAQPLLAVCRRCMARDPMGRYASASDVAADIERWLADEELSVWSGSWSTRSRRWLRKHPSLVTAASVLVLASIAGAISYSILTTTANQQLKVANVREQAARKLADEQTDLALRSLQTVAFDIQRKLKYVPAAHKVRLQMLETAINGLEQVATERAQRQAASDSIIAHREMGELLMEVGDVGNIQGLSRARQELEEAARIAKLQAKAILSPSGLTVADKSEAKHKIAVQKIAVQKIQPTQINRSKMLGSLPLRYRCSDDWIHNMDPVQMR